MNVPALNFMTHLDREFISSLCCISEASNHTFLYLYMNIQATLVTCNYFLVYNITLLSLLYDICRCNVKCSLNMDQLYDTIIDFRFARMQQSVTNADTTMSFPI